MKTKLIILIILLACSSVMQAQMKQTDENSLDEPIIPIDKQTRLANFNLILNQQYAFRNDFDIMVEAKHKNLASNQLFKQSQIKSSLAA